MKKIYLLLLVAVFVSVTKVSAQDGNNTMYWLENAPQRFRMNPAYQPEFKFVMFFPGLNGLGINYTNTAFGLSDVLKHKSTPQGDSLLINLHTLTDKLKDNNQIALGQDMSILGIGFKAKKSYITIDIVEKLDGSIGFGKELFEFISEGNKDYLGQTQDIGDFDIDVTSYVETALGYSRNINDHLRVGGRLKFLMGALSAKYRSSLAVSTSEKGDNMNLRVIQNLKTNAPIEKLEEGSEVEFDDIEFDSDNISDMIGNFGFAVDLGADYKMLGDRLTLSASLTDLGFIKWKKGVHQFSGDDDFDWAGADLTHSINKNDPDYVDVNDAFSDLSDSLTNSLKMVYGSGAYKTMLNTKFNLGASFQFCKVMNAAVLFRGVKSGERFFPSLTFSGNTRLLKNLGMSVSYSMMKGNYSSIGAGLTGRFGPFQFFALTDNVLSGVNLKNISARLGFNITVGPSYGKRNKEKSES